MGLHAFSHSKPYGSRTHGGLVEAFWLDLGFMLFFLAYAMVFNTLFDLVMRRRLARGGV